MILHYYNTTYFTVSHPLSYFNNRFFLSACDNGAVHYLSDSDFFPRCRIYSRQNSSQLAVGLPSVYICSPNFLLTTLPPPAGKALIKSSRDILLNFTCSFF